MALYLNYYKHNLEPWKLFAISPSEEYATVTNNTMAAHHRMLWESRTVREFNPNPQAYSYQIRKIWIE